MSKSNYDKAVDLIQKSYLEAVGPNNLFYQHSEQIKYDLQSFKSYDDWISRLHNRTDISQDDLWDLQCLLDSVKICFVLVGKDLL